MRDVSQVPAASLAQIADGFVGEGIEVSGGNIRLKLLVPRHGVELAGVVLLLGGGDPGEFVDRYLRITRRSRAAMERVLDA